MIASDLILEVPEDKAALKKAWTLNYTDARIEYLVRDVNHNLRGTAVRVSLNVEYMPIVGPFFKVRSEQLRPGFTRRPTPCPRNTPTRSE